jgi:hypothetical protein
MMPHSLRCTDALSGATLSAPGPEKEFGRVLEEVLSATERNDGGRGVTVPSAG